MTWATAVATTMKYAKRYWWIALVMLVVYFVEVISGVIHNVLAYHNPQVKTIVVTKVIKHEKEKRDLVVDETETLFPDGRVVKRKKTIDRTITDTKHSKDQNKTKEQKPVLVTGRMLSHSVGLSSGLNWDSPSASYSIRLKNLSGGISAPLNSQTMLKFRDGIRLNVSYGF